MITFTGLTTGIRWECSVCPAWGLSPDSHNARKHAAKHLEFAGHSADGLVYVGRKKD